MPNITLEAPSRVTVSLRLIHAPGPGNVNGVPPSRAYIRTPELEEKIASEPDISAFMKGFDSPK